MQRFPARINNTCMLVSWIAIGVIMCITFMPYDQTFKCYDAQSTDDEQNHAGERSFAGMSVALIGQAQSGWLESELISRLGAMGMTVTFVPVDDAMVIDLTLYDITIVTTSAISTRVQSLESSGARLLFIWDGISDISCEGADSASVALYNITITSSYGPLAGYPEGFIIDAGSANNFAFNTTGNLTSVAEYSDGRSACAYMSNGTSGARVAALGFLPRSESAWKAAYKAVAFIGERTIAFDMPKNVTLVTNCTRTGIASKGEDESFAALSALLGSAFVSKLDVAELTNANYSHVNVVVMLGFFANAEQFFASRGPSLVILGNGTRELADARNGTWMHVPGKCQFIVENSSKNTPTYGYPRTSKVFLDEDVILHDVPGFSKLIVSGNGALLSVNDSYGNGSHELALGIIPSEMASDGAAMFARCVNFCMGKDVVTETDPDGIVHVVGNADDMSVHEIALGVILSSAAVRANVGFCTINYSECAINLNQAALVVFSNSSYVGEMLQNGSGNMPMMLVGDGVRCLEEFGAAITSYDNAPDMVVDDATILSPAYGFAKSAAIIGSDVPTFAANGLPANFTPIVRAQGLGNASAVFVRNSPNAPRLAALGFYANISGGLGNSACKMIVKSALWALNRSIAQITTSGIVLVVANDANLTGDESALRNYFLAMHVNATIVDASNVTLCMPMAEQRFVFASQGCIGCLPTMRPDAGYILVGNAVFDISTAVGFFAGNVSNSWALNHSNMYGYQLIAFQPIDEIVLPKPFMLYANISSTQTTIEDMPANFTNLICPYDAVPYDRSAILAIHALDDDMDICVFSFTPERDGNYSSTAWRIFSSMLHVSALGNESPQICNITILKVSAHDYQLFAVVSDDTEQIERVEVHWALSNSSAAWHSANMTLVSNGTYYSNFTNIYGTMQYYIVAFDRMGNVNTTQVFELNPSYVNNSLPVPSLNYSILGYVRGAGFRVNFDASRSFDLDGNISNYRFFFGDTGSWSAWSVNPFQMHTYAHGGTFVVTLMVMDNLGAAAYLNISLFLDPVLENARPTALFRFSPTHPVVGQTINFDASYSSDMDGDDLTYQWNFGDGATSNDEVVQHTYTRPSSFDVRLTVSDGRLSSTWETTVVVSRGGTAMPDTAAFVLAGTAMLVFVIFFAIAFVIWMKSKEHKRYPIRTRSYAQIRACPKCGQTLGYSPSSETYYCYFCKKHMHAKMLDAKKEDKEGMNIEVSRKDEVKYETKPLTARLVSAPDEVKIVEAKLAQERTRTDEKHATETPTTASPQDGQKAPSGKGSITKCPKCKTIIKLESANRPIAVQCPNCGTKGTLK